nr:hypothetical protein [Acidobacteriota bacterium]
MNAIDTSRRVGLIELPELAELLTRYGITAVTGPDFKSAVAAIKTESAKRAIPIIVADNPTPGLRSWVNRIQQSAPIKVAVVRNLQSPVIDAGSAAEILTPASINDILSTVGLPTLDGPDGLRTFPESVVEAGGGFELPDFDFDDLEDDDLAAAVPVQISAPEPVYEPAPATTPVVPVANE